MNAKIDVDHPVALQAAAAAHTSSNFELIYCLFLVEESWANCKFLYPVFFLHSEYILKGKAIR